MRDALPKHPSSESSEPKYSGPSWDNIISSSPSYTFAPDRGLICPQCERKHSKWLDIYHIDAKECGLCHTRFTYEYLYDWNRLPKNRQSQRATFVTEELIHLQNENEKLLNRVASLTSNRENILNHVKDLCKLLYAVRHFVTLAHAGDGASDEEVERGILRLTSATTLAERNFQELAALSLQLDSHYDVKKTIDFALRQIVLDSDLPGDPILPSDSQSQLVLFEQGVEMLYKSGILTVQEVLHQFGEDKTKKFLLQTLADKMALFLQSKKGQVNWG